MDKNISDKDKRTKTTLRPSPCDLPAIIFIYLHITETREKDTLYSRLSVAWMLQSSLHGGIYGAS